MAVHRDPLHGPGLVGLAAALRLGPPATAGHRLDALARDLACGQL